MYLDKKPFHNLHQLTIWYPIAIARIIRQSVPKVDKFTELGRPRNQVEMNAEYQRLLNRDLSPFAFLYRGIVMPNYPDFSSSNICYSGYRRGWGTYESIYLLAKLTTLLVIAVIDSNNCFFRSLSRTAVPIARQILLLLSTIGFFVAQCIITPFLDPVNNASEWTSRLSYVAIAATALAVTLDIPGSSILNSYVLYGIYILTYGLIFCVFICSSSYEMLTILVTDFAIINFSWMQRVVKRTNLSTFHFFHF